MTPDRRLDQLEPLVADVLQKVDRLIEGQGQLFELVGSTITGLDQLTSSTEARFDQVTKTVEITASGLARLTVTVTDMQEEMRQRFDQSDQTQQEILALLRRGLK